MRKKVVTGMLVTLLILSMLTLVFSVRQVGASGTIYIKADGSVDPPTAPISTLDYITYTFTDNIYDEIVVERSSIVVDGRGYTVQGGGAGTGIYLRSYADNVTIRNLQIQNFYYGIGVASSSNVIQNNIIAYCSVSIRMVEVWDTKITENRISYNDYGIDTNTVFDTTVSGNDITNNGYGITFYWASNSIVSGNTIANNWAVGIYLQDSSNNTISGNNITNNGSEGIVLGASFNNIISGNSITNNGEIGIELDYSSDNYIYHNNFIDNAQQVYIWASNNVWDDGYPSGGNYWSDYNERYPYAEELDGSGIWDTPYVIDENNQDNYPLMRPLPETTICIDPTPVSVYVCENFTVAVNVKDVTDLYTWQFKLSWNPSLLECVGYIFGPFLPPPTIRPPPVINNTAGWILAGDSRMMPPGVNGSGTIFYIKFHCDGPGECDLVFSGSDTFLLDSNAMEIPCVEVNGHVIQKPPIIYIDPTPATATVCENFTVALNVKYVTDLYAWQVKLSFNPTLLECLSVTEGPFLTSSGLTIWPTPMINNTAGTILACCSLMSPQPGASGNGTLAYIKFHCDGPGECDLVFFPFLDTFLLDSHYNSIPHTAVNGHVHQEAGHGSTRYPWPMFRHNPRHTGYTKSPVPSTNQTIWNFTTGLDVRSSPAVVNGIVFVGSNDRKVYALDQHTGAQVWNFTTGGWVTSSPSVADGKVFVGSRDRKVYCLDATTGVQVWNFTTGLGVGSSPAVANGKVYVGSYDGKVYCLDATTGVHIWNFTTGLDVESSPAVADGKVFVGSGEDDKVYCLDATTGAHVWNFTTGGITDSSPAVVGGKVYVGSGYPEGGKVYCLDATTGAHVWNFTTGGWVLSSPAVADGKVYVGGDYKVYCLNATTGAHVWNFTTGNIVDSSPAVADGKVYVGSYDCKVYCLDARTGVRVWSFTTGSWVISSPAVADGMVFVGSNDRKVYAFGNIVRAEDFPTVQEAINNATSGATIIIAPGTYYNQSMVINKTLTIIGLPGSAPIFDGGGSGIFITLLPGASGTTITGIVITNWDQGIFFANSSNCKIYGNIMSLMDISGIVLEGKNAANNRIYNNIFQGNYVAINLTKSSANNIIYHNNFIANTDPVCVSPEVYANIWDNDYPSGGNYWSDYAGVDADGDGIGDTPYIIDSNNRDRYPLVKPFRGLAITKATTSKTVIGQGFTLSINVTILNHGVDDEVSTITVHANTTVKASLAVTLTNRNFTKVTLLWNTTGVAKGNYTITAKATPFPDETDTTDNTYTDGWIIVAMVSDITGPDGWPDGKCDMRDIGTVARLFGVNHPDPRYNPNCDVIYDLKIDMKDIGTVARHFGETDP